MAILTKISKPISDYQEWDQTELNVGDIIDVETSLGKAARYITIESTGDDSVVRFNVVQKIFHTQGSLGNAKQLGPTAYALQSGSLVGEVELPKPDIVVEIGSSQSWRDGEIAVKDIKIVKLAPGTRILVS